MTKEPKVDVWMPLVIGDYRKHTSKLRAAQHGAYLLLIMEYWINGPIADDDEEIASIVAMDLREWKKNRPKLQRFFTIVDGVWRHERIDSDLIAWGEKKAKAVARAKEAADRRWGNRDAPSNAPGIGQALRKQCPSTSSATLEPLHGSSASGSRFSNLDLRAAFAKELGEAWTVSWVDPCMWRDLPTPAIVAPRDLTAKRVRDAMRRLPTDLVCNVIVELAA